VSLAKKYRLGQQKEFELVKKRGKLYSTSLLGLLVLPAEKKETPSRFGFLISRKVDRRAVWRNRLRRRLAAVVNSLLPRIKNGWRVIFLPRPSLKDQSLTAIREMVEELLSQANLLHHD